MSPAYLLIGSGRLSTHMGHYLRLLGIPNLTWSRTESKDALAEKASVSSHILCLISDPVIEGFLAENAQRFSGKTLVHASGSISTSLAESAHPLMTFTSDLYDLDTYRSIPFILEKGRRSFSEILPGLPNPHFSIESAQKPLYHALCVMSGNFTVLLWQKVFREFATELKLPYEALLPYLDRIARNLASSPEGALTGPIARGDTKTIEKHLQTLGDDPYAQVYKAFVDATHATAFLEVRDENRTRFC